MVFDIYKRGQGYYTRLYSALGGFVIIALGSWRLYGKLQGLDLGGNLKIWIEVVVPAAVFVGLGFLIFLIVNRPTIADFMITAEGEIKKVNWSSRKEIAVSTFIVICVVSFMACCMAVADFLFAWFFSQLL